MGWDRSIRVGECSIAPPGPGDRTDGRCAGVVQSVTRQGGWHKATVKFAGAGVKKLILEKADLEIVEE